MDSGSSPQVHERVESVSTPIGLIQRLIAYLHNAFYGRNSEDLVLSVIISSILTEC